MRNSVSRLRFLFLLPLMALAGHPAAAQEGPPGPGLITVTGEATVPTEPDMATVTLGVTSQAKTAAEALSSNSAALQAVMTRLTEAGLEGRDIQTSDLSLSPNWTNDEARGNVIDGYMASNVITLHVRDLTKLGGVLDAVVADGANTLNGVSFGLQDPKPVQSAARKEAVEDARDRAETLAQAAGVSLGRVVSISEGTGYMPPQPVFRMERMVQDDAVPVSAGEIGFSSSVTLVYEIAP